MAPNCRPRPDLEKLIPQSILNNFKRECSRSECRSKDVVMRYFNNNKYDQPRFFCIDCRRFFTLGGKLRESYTKAKDGTEKATARTKTGNLQAEGAKTGESSGSARCLQRKTRSSRQGSVSAIQTKGKALEDTDEDTDEETDEETDLEDTEEDIESEEYESEIGDSEDDDESEDEDGELVLLDLNKSASQESNLAREDEEMHEAEQIEQLAEETEELAASNLPRDWIQDRIPADEVLESTEETPAVLDTTSREELPPSPAVSKTELLRLKAQEHLLAAQTTLEEVCIEKLAMEMQLECIEIEHRREQEKRENLYPGEEMLRNLQKGVVKYMREWLVGPLTDARYETLAAREASLNKVGQTVESLANEVREMENMLVSHETMVKVEKKAKRLWDRVVKLTD